MKYNYIILIGIVLFSVLAVAAQSDPYYQITDGPSTAGPFCDNEGGSVPTFRDFPMTGSIFGSVSVAGVGVIRTDTLSSFGPASGVNTWFFDGTAFSVPAGTAITIVIESYSKPNLGGRLTHRSTLVFDCSNGNVMSLSNTAFPVGVTLPSNIVTLPEPAPVCYELLGNDGRLNSNDCAAPIAIYLAPLQIYGIDPSSSEGTVMLNISDESIEELGIPASNTLLGEAVNSFMGQTISVWRLSSGEFQLNTYYADGKPYILIWGEGGANLRYIER